MRSNLDQHLVSVAHLRDDTARTYSPAIDMGPAPGYLPADIVVSAPEIPDLPDGHSISYTLQHSVDASGTWADLYDVVGHQTGIDASGTAAQDFRAGLPSSAERYIRLAAWNSHADDLRDHVVVLGARL